MEEKVLEIIPCLTVDSSTMDEVPDPDDAVRVTSDGFIVCLPDCTAIAGDDLSRAAERGFTIYGNSKHDPMLSHAVETAHSLTAGRRRPCIAVTVKFTGLNGGPELVSVERALFESAGQLSFGLVDKILNDDSHPAYAMWEAIRARAFALSRFREGNEDALDDGFLSHSIIQEFMIAVNRLMTLEAERRNVPIIWRVSDAEGNDKNVVRYSVTRGPHGPLGFESYGHWTSPLRRCGDLANWKNFFAAREEAQPVEQSALVKICDAMNSIEQNPGRQAPWRRLRETMRSRPDGFAAMNFAQLVSTLQGVQEGQLELQGAVMDVLMARFNARPNAVLAGMMLGLRRPAGEALQQVRTCALQWLEDRLEAMPSALSASAVYLGYPYTEAVELSGLRETNDFRAVLKRDGREYAGYGAKPVRAMARVWLRALSEEFGVKLRRPLLPEADRLGLPPLSCIESGEERFRVIAAANRLAWPAIAISRDGRQSFKAKATITVHSYSYTVQCWAPQHERAGRQIFQSLLDLFKGPPPYVPQAAGKPRSR